MELKPYIFFNGRCAEALEFYKGIFGGSYEAMRNADAPDQVKQMMPDADPNRIMHASFSADGFGFYASDGRQSNPIDPDAGNVSICLDANAADAERVCNALAEGGKVVMPLEDAFWGGKFANVIDKFGTDWFITGR